MWKLKLNVPCPLLWGECFFRARTVTFFFLWLCEFKQTLVKLKLFIGCSGTFVVVLSEFHFHCFCQHLPKWRCCTAAKVKPNYPAFVLSQSVILFLRVSLSICASFLHKMTNLSFLPDDGQAKDTWPHSWSQMWTKPSVLPLPLSMAAPSEITSSQFAARLCCCYSY